MRALPLAVLAACWEPLPPVDTGGGSGGGSGGGAGAGPSLLDRYLAALCPYLSEGGCGENRQSSCGEPVAYETTAQCAATVRERLARDCPDAADRLDACADAVEECIEALSSFDCAEGRVCADGADLLASGPCAEVAAALPGDCRPF